MSSRILSVDRLGKRYRIQHQHGQCGYVTLREVITSKLSSTFARAIGRATSPRHSGEMFWALRDASFDVCRGEVMGIVGRNGAGKSTLLKILSGITDPTEGRVTVGGRIASLLEVGTGFHPELTGRENIFLNGVILGMARTEIARKFDEIVDFAGVEKFLDTPVKRYSSGMYVRLAFAVAAHLEPEILIVDEVLGVGDAEFQKKCLGKIRAVANTEGRTVLFVSHNIQAVQALCTRAILLDGGRIQSDGSAATIISQYVSQPGMRSGERTWAVDEAPGDGDVRLTAVRVTSAGQTVGTVSNRRPVVVELEFVANTDHPALCVGFDVMNAQGMTVLRTYQTDQPPEQWPAVRDGENRWQCEIPPGLLNGGLYYLAPRISIHNVNWIVHIDSVLEFEVLLDHGESPFWNSLNPDNRPGAIAPILKWTRPTVREKEERSTHTRRLPVQDCDPRLSLR